MELLFLLQIFITNKYFYLLCEHVHCLNGDGGRGDYTKRNNYMYLEKKRTREVQFKVIYIALSLRMTCEDAIYGSFALAT